MTEKLTKSSYKQPISAKKHLLYSVLFVFAKRAEVEAHRDTCSIALLAMSNANYTLTAIEIRAYGPQNDGSIMRRSEFASVQNRIELPETKVTAEEEEFLDLYTVLFLMLQNGRPMHVLSFLVFGLGLWSSSIYDLTIENCLQLYP
uniref:Uncharacterized protein n=1 Tax=Glossina austeni TaxID=7395 RepID=A0A1A9URD7_GLOAU